LMEENVNQEENIELVNVNNNYFLEK